MTNNLEVGLTLVPLNTPQQKISAITTLFYEAQAGPYQLQVVKQTATYEPYIINFELAIDTVANIKAAVSASGLEPMCSSSTPFSAITPSPSGDYSYSNHQLYLSQNAVRSQRTYVTAPMVLDQASVVYAKASFNYLLSEMEIAISGNNIKNITCIIF